MDAPEGTFLADPEHPEGWRQASQEAPRLSGGEGAALRVHSSGCGTGRRLGTDLAGIRQRADKRLPDIAGLIDPAQFGLITRPSSGFLAIRGAAGSGKTTVALHRIAYLAYDDPEIDSPATLFVVFSQGLRDYVSHVLPALGVEGVQVRTFARWAAEVRRRLFPRLPEARREDTPALVQRLKLSPALAVALAEQVQRTPGPAQPARVLDDLVSVLGARERLLEVFAREAPGSFRESQIGDVASWCRARWQEVEAWMEGDRDTRAELDPEDDALLLRAWQLRGGQLGPRGRPLRYRHVAIDEVQDFAPLEVQVLLGCLDERRSLTLAGDTQQHVMQEAGFTSWSEFFHHLGLDGTEVETLQVSYRSSAEITRFALALLGPLREDGAAPRSTRSGPPVELFGYTDHGACIAALADALERLSLEEPLASVAVLAPSRELSDLYSRGLAQCDVPRLHQVRQQDFRFAPGVEITEVDQVKGLEFDYVILLEVSEEHYPDEPRSRRLLHVGATRAVHQLWLTSAGSPAKIVEVAVATCRGGGVR